MPLDADQQSALLLCINVWRAAPAPERRPACPLCGTAEMDVVDQSVRPYAEWYAVSCRACGLSETLHVTQGRKAPETD